MGVKTFAWVLVALGLAMALYGWQAWNPAAFVGMALAAVGIVVLATSGRRPGGCSLTQLSLGPDFHRAWAYHS